VPPAIETLASEISTLRRTFNWCRKAPPLNVRPVHSARVFVAFAGTGGTPVKSRAGNAMKLPPPATAFNAPPSTAARKRKTALPRLK